jgi:hypothetical protein
MIEKYVSVCMNVCMYVCMYYMYSGSKIRRILPGADKVIPMPKVEECRTTEQLTMRFLG